VDLAKKTNPASASEIDAHVAALAAAAEQARIEKLKHESFWQGFSGEGQFGFSASTGTSSTTNIAAGLSLTKATLHWTHTLTLSADYDKSNGILSQEKYFAGYEGHYNFTPRFYAVLQGSWDRDTFAGYTSREGGSLGLGYKIINTPAILLSLEAGPGVRNTTYVLHYSQTSFAGRVAGTFSWKLTPTTIFSEVASAYLDNTDDTLNSTTAITTKLVGALSARASFAVQHDTQPPVGYDKTGTITRLTLVYGF
jgi:putative salt-induced outer membrane protein